MLLRRLAPLAVSLCLVSCASRSAIAIPTPPVPAVDTAALTVAGCYRCLEEAFNAAAAGGDARTAFEVALLLTLRSKELGLPPERWLAAARERLPEGTGWAAYLETVTLFPRAELSADRSVLQEESIANRRPREAYDALRAELKSGAGSPLVRAYLDLSIACRPDAIRNDFQAVRDGAVAAVIAEQGTSTPLLQYMLGQCGGEAADQLLAVRAGEPRFVDVELELGRRELQKRPRPDIPEAFRRFGLAIDAFPDSPVAHGVLARLHERREQWTEAVARWDTVLTLVPGHGDALLGRTIALSQLLQHEEAVAAATHVIDVAPSHRADAYYWRAWNQFRLARYDVARVDADAAKALAINAPLFLLSGMIEWELKRPESAEKEFLETLVVDLGYCEAASYLGGVRLELRKWPESLAAFQQARQCYDLSIQLRRQLIASLSTTPAEEQANAFEIGGHQRAVATAERRHGEALQNIAALQKFLSGTR
jgi:tetratricopeptide (TPR) repeat protein